MFSMEFILVPKISTHSLTRRLTRKWIERKTERDISTHSLTRRLTPKCNRTGKRYLHFNSQPHKEADEFSMLSEAEKSHFNSQPHKEADVSYQTCEPDSRYFNSQPHKEADFCIKENENYENISTHSLTRRLTFFTWVSF